MKWLAGWDFSTRVVPAWPVWLGQMVFSVICTSAFIILRFTADLFAPSAGPFALIYPAVLFATLLGRWRAGLVTILLSILYVWFFVLPFHGSFVLEKPSDGPRMLVNVVSMSVIVLLAEIFRRAVADAAAERESRIEERDLLLRELDHRVKNNLAGMVGLIQLQRRRATDPSAIRELDTAVNRIESLAAAHDFLRRDRGDIDAVDMQPYLGKLCDALSKALLVSDRVKILCEVEPIALQQDRAASVGLIVNEMVTNAIKHAYPDNRAGQISVWLGVAEGHITLRVSDDGCGMPEKLRSGSLGHRLIDNFARRASGDPSITSSSAGTVFQLVLR